MQPERRKKLGCRENLKRWKGKNWGLKFPITKHTLILHLLLHFKVSLEHNGHNNSKRILYSIKVLQQLSLIVLACSIYGMITRYDMVKQSPLFCLNNLCSPHNTMPMARRRRRAYKNCLEKCLQLLPRLIFFYSKPYPVVIKNSFLCK